MPWLIVAALMKFLGGNEPLTPEQERSNSNFWCGIIIVGFIIFVIVELWTALDPAFH